MGVLAKEVNGLKHVTIFESRTKIELRPTKAYRNIVEDWTCEVNGEKIQLKKNEMKTIKIESDSLLKGECPSTGTLTMLLRSTLPTPESPTRARPSLLRRRP